MNLSRFFLGLALLAIALLAFKLTTDPLAGSNIAAMLGEATGGVMGGLIWGLIIWAPIRLVRGANKAPDVRNFTLYTAAIMVALFIVFRFFVGTPLSNSERMSFHLVLKRHVSRLSESQRKMPASLIHSYGSIVLAFLHH